MKKTLLLAIFSIAGLAGAKNLEVKELKAETTEKAENKQVFIYNPISVTSSCGYTEFIEIGGSNISCLEVEIDRMEEECYAPITGWGYA